MCWKDRVNCAPVANPDASQSNSLPNFQTARTQRAEAGAAWALPEEKDMEFISKAIDRLPPWAKLIFWVFAIIAIVYSIAKYGFWTILLKAIFSP
jgi:type VI protein secretion system component VasF